MSRIDDLIEQMNPKRDPEEIGSDKKTKHNEKFKSSMKETEIDYYKILGVPPTATLLEIKRAFREKIITVHPDKAKQTPETKEKYKLIREAGACLTNPQERKAYDMQRKMDSEFKEFKDQKDSFKEFIKLQEQSMTEEDKAVAKLNFERGIADFDRKHGYNRKHADPISKDEYDRKLEDLELHRKQEDMEIEMHQKNPFEGRQFNPSEFNKLFERKKKHTGSKSSLVKYDGDISAYNDYDGGTGGVALNNYDSLYSDGAYNDYNESYAGIGAGMIGTGDGNSDDDISIDSLDEDDAYDAHNKGVTKESLDAAMKRMLAERSEQDDALSKMSQTEYGSAIDDKYGISSQFGFMIGDDKFGQQKSFKKRNVKEETIKAYKQLTEK